MMESIPLNQRIEMVLIYGQCLRNIDNAVDLYAELFPDMKRSRSSFYRVIREFTTEGTVHKRKKNRKRTSTGENNEINVLAQVAVDPHVSTRQISQGAGISQTSVCRILKRHKFHPFHISLHQELHDNDFQNRITFCQWALQKIHENRIFFRHVLFSDESTFTNHGEINRHNMHYWSVDNPHWIRQVERQRPWSVNVWCGIIGDKLIGPVFINGTLNGEKYRDLIRNELPILLEDLSLEVRQNMWFQNDGCPSHYSTIARNELNRQFYGRWIGRGGTVNWPARSPDLTSPDFYLWGFLKSKVYNEVPTTPENMRQRIRDACTQVTPEVLLSCVHSFERRINKCIEEGGHHFEHLL